jgi:hypothetical protein
VLLQPADGKSTALTSPILKIPILQLVGSRSAFLNETINVNTKLDPANTEWVKVSNACGLVLDEKSEEVTESILLFLQGLGYCEFICKEVNQRISSHSSERSQNSRQFV